MDSHDYQQREPLTAHGALIRARVLSATSVGSPRFSEIKTTNGDLTVYGVFDSDVAGLPVAISADGLRVHVGGLGNRSFVRAPGELINRCRVGVNREKGR